MSKVIGRRQNVKTSKWEDTCTLTAEETVTQATQRALDKRLTRVVEEAHDIEAEANQISRECTHPVRTCKRGFIYDLETCVICGKGWTV